MILLALEVRGSASLRIIYGTDYDAPEDLVRLRKRGLALREFLLSHEALIRSEALDTFIASTAGPLGFGSCTLKIC